MERPRPTPLSGQRLGEHNVLGLKVTVHGQVLVAEFWLGLGTGLGVYSSRAREKGRVKVRGRVRGRNIGLGLRVGEGL